MADRKSSEAAGDGRQYTAPALEKGLDVLELLARESRPMNVSAIVAQLGRSVGELFRMIQVLEYRGFIEQVEGGGGYKLTSRLFQLGLDQPSHKSVLEAAIPVMRLLAAKTGQSCHVAIHSEGEIVVIWRAESSEQIGFSVRPGYRRALHKTVSGQILFAFQPQDIRDRWEKLLKPKPGPAELTKLRRSADQIREDGYYRAVSAFVEGITDISAPIISGGVAVAALAVPFVHSTSARMGEEEVTAEVVRAAAIISSEFSSGE